MFLREMHSLFVSFPSRVASHVRVRVRGWLQGKRHRKEIHAPIPAVSLAMPRRAARSSYIPRNNNYQGARARDGESPRDCAREASKRLGGGDACGVHACGVMYASCVCGGMRKMGSLYVLHAQRHPKVESLGLCRRRTRTHVRACILYIHTRARVSRYDDDDTNVLRCVRSRPRSVFDFALHASPLRIESLALGERALITPRDTRWCKVTLMSPPHVVRLDRLFARWDTYAAIYKWCCNSYVDLLMLMYRRSFSLHRPLSLISSDQTYVYQFWKIKETHIRSVIIIVVVDD